MEHPKRDYRFRILTGEGYRHSSTNLIKALPRLIIAYLEVTGFSPITLRIYLDGRLDARGKDFLRSEFLGKRGIQKVVVGNFIKRQKHSKNLPRPPVVYFADVLAN